MHAAVCVFRRVQRSYSGKFDSKKTFNQFVGLFDGACPYTLAKARRAYWKLGAEQASMMSSRAKKSGMTLPKISLAQNRWSSAVKFTLRGAPGPPGRIPAIHSDSAADGFDGGTSIRQMQLSVAKTTSI